MPGVVCCMCGNSRAKDPHASFHRFPSKQAKRAVWLRVFQLEESQIKPYSRVCSRHFPDGDAKKEPQANLGKHFASPMKRGSRLQRAKGREVSKQLHELTGSIPSLPPASSGKQVRLSTVICHPQRDRKHLTVTRVYSDEKGESRFGSFNIQMKGSGDIGYLSEHIAGNGVIFRQTPGDYHFSWHNAPRRQFIVNLDADVEVEVSSGEKKVIGQGQVFFVEDTTGKGHFSRAVGGKARHSIFIPVPDDFVAKDC